MNWNNDTPTDRNPLPAHPRKPHRRRRAWLLLLILLCGCAMQPDDAALAERVRAEAAAAQARAAETAARVELTDAQSRAEVNGAAIRQNAALLDEVNASAASWRALAIGLAAFMAIGAMIGALVAALALARRREPTVVYLPTAPPAPPELTTYSAPYQAWPELAAERRARLAALVEDRR